MGAYSTVDITRQYAISKILELVDEATNEELSGALFALTENRCLDNYRVVDTESECNNNGRLPGIDYYFD